MIADRILKTSLRGHILSWPQLLYVAEDYDGKIVGYVLAKMYVLGCSCVETRCGTSWAPICITITSSRTHQGPITEVVSGRRTPTSCLLLCAAVST